MNREGKQRTTRGVPMQNPETDTVSQRRQNERLSQQNRNKRIKVTLPKTPWDKDEDEKGE